MCRRDTGSGDHRTWRRTAAPPTGKGHFTFGKQVDTPQADMKPAEFGTYVAKQPRVRPWKCLCVTESI